MNKQLIFSIILSFAVFNMFSQASKGRVVLWPGVALCEAKGYIQEHSGDNGSYRLNDYERCTSDIQIDMVISDMTEALNKDGFTAVSYVEELKNCEKKRLEAEKLAAKYKLKAQDEVDDLSNYSNADMTLYLNYVVKEVAGKKQVSFQIKVIDTGSSITVASATALNSSTAMTEDEMIRTASISKLAEVTSKMSEWYTDISGKGRFVNAYIRFAESAGGDMNRSLDGTTLEFFIKKFIFENCAGGDIAAYEGAQDYAAYEPLRIAYNGAAGKQSCKEFLGKLKDHLASKGIVSEIVALAGDTRSTLIITQFN